MIYANNVARKWTEVQSIFLHRGKKSWHCIHSYARPLELFSKHDTAQPIIMSVTQIFKYIVVWVIVIALIFDVILINHSKSNAVLWITLQCLSCANGLCSRCALLYRSTKVASNEIKWLGLRYLPLHKYGCNWLVDSLGEWDALYETCPRTGSIAHTCDVFRLATVWGIASVELPL